MSQESRFFWAFVISGLGVWIMIPGLNRPLLWLLDRHLVQGLLWLVEKSVIWLFWLLKWMWSSHWILLRHLLTPRSILLPTTETQRRQSP